METRKRQEQHLSEKVDPWQSSSSPPIIFLLFSHLFPNIPLMNRTNLTSFPKSHLSPREIFYEPGNSLFKEKYSLRTTLSLHGCSRSTQDGSSSHQAHSPPRVPSVPRGAAAWVPQKSRGSECESLFYHFLILGPWPNHSLPGCQFLFMECRVTLLWELRHSKHMEIFIQMSNIVTFIAGLYTSQFSSRELLALPTGVLSLQTALGLTPAASAADSEGCKTVGNRYERQQSVELKREGQATRLPGLWSCWVTLGNVLDSTGLCLYKSGITVAQSAFFFIHSSFIL